MTQVNILLRPNMFISTYIVIKNLFLHDTIPDHSHCFLDHRVDYLPRSSPFYTKGLNCPECFHL